MAYEMLYVVTYFTKIHAPGQFKQNVKSSIDVK